MSQYGADAMAEEGKTYSEILQHYYTGVTVEECPKIKDETMEDKTGLIRLVLF